MLATYIWLTPPKNFFNIFELIGIRMEGFLLGSLMPLVSTMILFLGPIVMGLIDDYEFYFNLENLKSSFQSNIKDIYWWRAIIVAPISEEFVFRGCMCPLLYYAGIPLRSIIILAPLFFGVAHLHHFIKHLRQGTKFLKALLISVFQLFYTTIFGSMATYYFLRTGHISGCILTHMFCNLMGFPDIPSVPSHKYKIVIGISYVLGIILFFLTLDILTLPSLTNTPYL